jgi:hypothetical protein
MEAKPMIRTADNVTVWPLRTRPKDIGVALVVLTALLLGWLLRWSVEGNTRVYENADHTFSISYPATWRTNNVTDTVVLRVEDSQTNSAYKTNVTVESRELDPSSPPTLQELIDRRVVQHGGLTGYHFLSSAERTLAGARAAEIDFAFVAQPIDAPRRASLPVVARSREYIVVTKDRAYFIALAAPESDFDTATRRFDDMLQTVRIP